MANILSQVFDKLLVYGKYDPRYSQIRKEFSYSDCKNLFKVVRFRRFIMIIKYCEYKDFL